MSTVKITCSECGIEFTSRSSAIICESCLNKTFLGYDVKEREAEPHTSMYSWKSFKEVNAALIEDCKRAKACGKSYGYYKADIRSIHRRRRK